MLSNNNLSIYTTVHSTVLNIFNKIFLEILSYPQILKF